MADELDFIEALDDLSNLIKSTKEKFDNNINNHSQNDDDDDDGIGSSSLSMSMLKSILPQQSHQNKNGGQQQQNLILLNDLENFISDTGGGGGGEEEEYTMDMIKFQFARENLWSACQILVEILLSQRTFLQYTPNLEPCIKGIISLLLLTSSSLSSTIENENDTITANTKIKQYQCLLTLMIQTIEYHNQHECTELRYVTLLEILLSHIQQHHQQQQRQQQPCNGNGNDNGWSPSVEMNALWQQFVEKHVETDCDPIIFRKEAYKVLISLPWTGPIKTLPSSLSSSGSSTSTSNAANTSCSTGHSSSSNNKGLLLYNACSCDISDSILHPTTDLPHVLLTRLLDGRHLQNRHQNDPITPSLLSSLLLRSDKIHSILQQIEALEKEDEQEPFTIGISYNDDHIYTSAASGASSSTTTATSIYNGEGTGKTTLAALIASHPSIAEKYTILWADLGNFDSRRRQQQQQQQQTEEEDANVPSFSYQQYADCLENLCQQIGTKPNWSDRILRLEDESVRIKREMEYIELAKVRMSNLLEQRSATDHLGKILLVIDGVVCDRDFELFQFIPDEQSNIVVSSKSNYIPQADITIEIDDLSIEEAIVLFALESTCDCDDIIFNTVECRAVIQQCLYHPLLIRTVARWFRLKQVTAGPIKALNELNLELRMLRNSSSTTGNNSNNADAFKVLAEIMNSILSPNRNDDTIGEPTILLKLCLSSVAVVFGENLVPLDAVIAMWEQLLATHIDAMEEIGSNDNNMEGESSAGTKKIIWYTVELFIFLGIFSPKEEIINDDCTMYVKLHCSMYVSYGLSLVPEVQDAEAEIVDTVAKWHSLFVLGYHERIKILKAQHLESRIYPYILKKLIIHMIEARSIPQVLERLRDEKFCRDRLNKYGWLKGARLHVEDCVLLGQRARESKSTTAVEIRKVILSCLKRIAIILGEEEANLTNNQRVEKATAIHLIGFTAADHRGISEALAQYKTAMHVMNDPGDPFNAVIMYSQAVLHLLRNDYDKGLKKIKGSLKVLKDLEGKENVPALQPELLQLKGDAMAASCDYVGAEKCYEESLKQIDEQSKIETGNLLYRRARIHQLMGELDQSLSALAECINWKHNIGEASSRYLVSAYSVAADIYLELEEDDSALRHFQHALTIAKDMEDEIDEMEFHLLQGKIESIKSDDGNGGQEAFEKARKLIKNSPRLLMDQSAYDLRCIGKIYADRGQKKEAIQIFEEGIDLTQNRPESLERACILFELASCMLDVGDTKESVTCYEESLLIRKSKLGDCELVLDTHIEVGKMYRKLNMHQESLERAKDVMYLTEKLYRGDEARAAGAIFGVAEAYEILNEYKESILMFEECKELLKRSLSGDDPDVAKVLQRIGKLHADNNEIEKAHGCYSEALEICKKSLESDHPQLGETLFGAGVIARKSGDLEMARDCLQASLKVYKEIEMSRELCLALIELGNVYRTANDPDTAIMCYERCLTFLEADEGDESASVSDHLYIAYGHARLSKMELDGANDFFLKALEIRKEKLGRDHVGVAVASLAIGIVKYLMKSFVDARVHLDDYIRTMNAKEASDTSSALAFLLLGEISLRAESRPDEARQNWRKARDAIQNNPSMNESMPELGEILSSRMDNEQAAQPEQKSFFSRFTAGLALEDEQVTRELPVEERIEAAIRSFNFEDIY